MLAEDFSTENAEVAFEHFVLNNATRMVIQLLSQVA